MKKFKLTFYVLLLLVAALFTCGCDKLAAVEDIVSQSEQSREELNSAPEDNSSFESSSASGFEDASSAEESSSKTEDIEAPIDEDGSYTSKEDVALYIRTYGKLPGNFITKKEAEKLGWTGGSLEKYAPGKCIGGDRFGNYEELLPTKSGRQYTECDIDTLGKKSRGAKRIVFSNDGLIFYTDDHYESFTQLYPEE